MSFIAMSLTNVYIFSILLLVVHSTQLIFIVVRHFYGNMAHSGT